MAASLPVDVTLVRFPEARRQGVGSALVDAVVDWARSQDMGKLVLDVVDKSRPAIALYEYKGFAKTGVVTAQPPPSEHLVEYEYALIL